MKAVILCGGFGTRIRDVADDIPKPLIPVGGLPIIWHIMKYYAHYGHKEFVLCLGYKGGLIKDFFLNYKANTSDFTVTLGETKSVTYHNQHSEADWSVTLADTGLTTMTGGRVKRIASYIGDDSDFLLTYGDGVSNVDIDSLVSFHKEHGKLVTMTGVRPPGRWGELELGDNGLVESFVEKPQASGGVINGGFFVCKRELFELLGDNEDLVFEQEPMKELVARRELMVFHHNDFWQAMDTHRDYKYLNEIIDSNKAPWTVWNK